MPQKKKKKVEKPKKDLEQALMELSKRVKRSNSLWWVLIRGLLTGVATALGATIVAGLLVWLLYQVVSTLEFIPIVNDLIEQTPLAELLEQELKN